MQWRNRWRPIPLPYTCTVLSPVVRGRCARIGGLVYSILSDATLQLNVRLVFLSNISCSVLTAGEAADVHCSNHPGTCFGEMALVTRGGEQLVIASGDVDSGFARVTRNGVALAVRASYGSAPLPAFSHQHEHALSAWMKDEAALPSSATGTSTAVLPSTSTSTLILSHQNEG